MDLNILPLEERIVMDAAGGLLEASDAVYVDAAKALEYAKSEDGVDETARNAEGVTRGAAESILASFTESFKSEVDNCDEEDKELLRKAAAECAENVENSTFVSTYEGTSDWVETNNLLDNDERIEMLMRGI